MAILNHRDYRLAKARVAQLQRATGSAGLLGTLAEQLPPEAAKARRSTLEAELDRVIDQVGAYERLRADGLKVGDEVDTDLGVIVNRPGFAGGHLV